VAAQDRDDPQEPPVDPAEERKAERRNRAQ